MIKHISKIFSIVLIVLIALSCCSIIASISVEAATFTPRRNAPAKDNKYYYSNINPFYKSGNGMPNCTCYAYGRAYEILGKDPGLPTRNACNWYTLDKKYKHGKTPKLGAIACWTGPSTNSTAKNGHVAVVEKINGNKISVSESQYNGKTFYYHDNFDPTTYLKNVAPYNYTFQGYIYIGDFSDAPTLSSISVATPPMCLVYEDGSTFNPAEMVIKATYSDGSSKNVTGYKTSYDFSAVGDTKVTISYTENGVTKTTTQQVSVSNEFEGSGTDADPYKINNIGNLFSLKCLVNNTNANGCYGEASYIQTADIDVGEMSEPIGSFYENCESTTITNYTAFNGHYNGNYHKLTNFIINNKRLYTGVFGRINKNAVIENLSVKGNVTSESSCVGGIVGEQGYGSIVRNCDFSGTVTGNSLVGGISGKIQGGGTVSSCYANAQVTASQDNGAAGGIVGYVLVGNKTSSVDFLCESSYFAGTVSGSQTGGVCGGTEIKTTKECTATFSKAYYLNTAAGGAVNGADTTGCAGVYASTLKNMASGLGDVFVNSTEAVNDGYPVFVWQTPSPFAGSGTAADPYQISSKKDLETMRDLVNNTLTNPVYGNACYIQTADIDLENESWFPIGPGYDGEDGLGDYNWSTRMFYGVYDGNRHTIYNLNVDKTYKSAGLFGVVRNEYAAVMNLAVTGTVNSGGTDNTGAGGITGAVHYGAYIMECAFIGNVTGNQYAGGIVGTVFAGGNINECYHTGNVKATSYAGGISGGISFGKYNSDGDSSEIEDCYHANGTITAGNYSGGIAGICSYYDGISTPVNIINSYVEIGSAVNIKSSGATSDDTVSVSASNMKTIGSFLLGESFIDNTNETLNSGYPVFEWQIVKVRGDVNLDGTVNVADIVILQEYLLKKSVLTDEEMYSMADVTGDGVINVFDNIALRRILL